MSLGSFLDMLMGRTTVLKRGPTGQHEMVREDAFIPLGSPIFASRPMVAPTQSVHHSRVRTLPPTQSFMATNKWEVWHPIDSELATKERASTFYTQANYWQRDRLGYLVP